MNENESKLKTTTMKMLMIVNLLFTLHMCQYVRAQIIQTAASDVCELKIDGNLKFLPVNKTWINTNDPCISYKCNSDVRIERNKQECNTTCDGNFIYKTVPGECCGKCYAGLCVDETTKEIYKEGDTWKSADNCTINECISDGLQVVVSFYKKSCPKLRNCPRENVEMRDCCPYCNRRQQKSAQFNLIEFSQRDTYRSHPCVRDCKKGETMTCQYEFIVEQYETMSKACYNCPKNLTDCYRPHCISADGMRRTIIVVNRMYPGPVIEVCHNDTIVVDVSNHLFAEGTSIHWHGIHQRNSPFMDGVPTISQCAIHPGQSFRYTFLAENPGTHMWHSHLGLQRSDGLIGPLIVREAEEFHENLYDLDMTEHILLTMDWIHESVNAKFTAHYHGRGDNKPSNVLINGRGKYHGNVTIAKNLSSPSETKTSKKIEVKERQEELTTVTEQPTTMTEEYQTVTETFTDFPTTTYPFIQQSYHYTLPSTPYPTTLFHNTRTHRVKRALAQPDEDSSLVPYETFNVAKGNRYRFRHINAGFLNCPIELSIDNHTITAIATDGTNIEPKEVTFLVSYAGERWDFVVNANQKVGNYFIRARGLLDCAFTSSFQLAILHYQGAGDEMPKGDPKNYNFVRDGTVLNALNAPHGQSNSTTVAETNAAGKQENFISQQKPDYKFFLSYDFYAKNNPMYHQPDLYGFDDVAFGKIYTPQINHISMKLPPMPAMIAQELLEDKFCNASSLEAQGINCKETFCECTHVLQVRLNSVVEMILVDEGVTYEANHMFHLHGNYFHVIGMDRLGTNVTIEEVKELDRKGKLRRKFTNSVRKDTVTVPDGGYTIIRLYADNPGLWLMHCHLDFHAEIGMAVVLKVGEFDEMLPVPDDFPTCQGYPSIKDSQNSGSTYLTSTLPVMLLSTFMLLNLL